MLSLPQPSLVASTVGRTSSLPLTAGSATGSADSSPEHTAPAISVIRPSRVSASVDDSALELLRAKYNAARSRDRASSMSLMQTADIAANGTSKSAENSPKLQRKASFKVKKMKLFRTPSNGVDGYEVLDADGSNDGIRFSRERITSVKRVLNRNSSFTSYCAPSPRPYSATSLVPAKHRIVQFNSSDDDDDDDDNGEDSINNLVSPVSESDLDFGSGSRSKGNDANYVSPISLCQRLVPWFIAVYNYDTQQPLGCIYSGCKSG